MVKWEYKTVIRLWLIEGGWSLDEKSLNVLGTEGWEMITCRFDKRSESVEAAVFKRPIDEPTPIVPLFNFPPPVTDPLNPQTFKVTSVTVGGITKTEGRYVNTPKRTKEG